MDLRQHDQHMMRLALRAAHYGLGRTADNPSVGAVVWDQRTDVILGVGRTSDGGRPHAERSALEMARSQLGLEAGSLLPECSMAVTLEPCSHHGQTPPCVDAIISAGIKRVIIAVRDRDCRVAGSGLAKLQAAGIDVESGVLADDAAWGIAGHLLATGTGRPFCQLKTATDVEGRVAQGDGTPKWVTGTVARRHGHLLRAQADAIVVGSGTVRQDNPSLTCRLEGLEVHSPLRVIIDRKRALAPNFQVFATASETPTLVVCEDGAASQSSLKHVDQISIPKVTPLAILQTLAQRGTTRVLIEGGPTLQGHFMRAGCVDEVCWYQSSSRFEGASLVPDWLDSLRDADIWQRNGCTVLGSDQLKRFRARSTLAELSQ